MRLTRRDTALGLLLLAVGARASIGASSVTLNGIFSDAACTLPLQSVLPALATLNRMLPTNGSCTSLPGLGAGSLTAGTTAGTFTLSGYTTAACAGAPSGFFENVPLNVCTLTASGYVLMSPTLAILGTYRTAAAGGTGTCGGASLGAPSVNAAGAVNKAAVCTSGADTSISISTLAGGVTFAVSAYSTAGCSGTPAAVWSTTAAGGCTTGSLVSILTGGTGLALAQLAPPPISITVNGLFTDASCTQHAAIPALTSLNTLALTDATCISLSPLGVGSVTFGATAGTYTLTGYTGTTCTGTPAALFANVPLNTCTPTASGYMLLSTTLVLLGTYPGLPLGGSAACTGTSFSPPTVLAVGAIGRPACTSNTSSIAIATLPGGTTFAVSSWTQPGCSGTTPAAAAWPVAPAAGCTVGAAVNLLTGGTGLSLTPPPAPLPPAPSAAPPAAPPATTFTAPQSIALLGVYADAACSILYPGVPQLDAVGVVGGCSGLPGLGSGLITATAGAGPTVFDVSGFAVTTACSGSALAVWKAAPLGVCTASQATPLPGIYVLLSSTLVVQSLGQGSACNGTALYGPTVAAVGLGGRGACTTLSNTAAGASAGSASVSIRASHHGYTVVGYAGSKVCAGAAAATWGNVSLNSCASASGMALALGGLASAPPASAAGAGEAGASALAVGLGVGLGVGIPVLVAILFFSGAFGAAGVTAAGAGAAAAAAAGAASSAAGGAAAGAAAPGAAPGAPSLALKSLSAV